jgi:hypothetical protein
VLSESLRVVGLQGAPFYNAEFSSPGSVRGIIARTGALFCTVTERVIVYHSQTEECGSVRLENGNRLSLAAGNVVMSSLSPSPAMKLISPPQQRLAPPGPNWPSVHACTAREARRTLV